MKKFKLKALTLVELLVVIAIVVILASLLFPIARKILIKDAPVEQVNIVNTLS